ncbi:MAG: molybdopterin-dependent oxidoreductase [Thermodesulfobacteriota bacterium]|nr:molybdopterin-dependent oxidoreductase [Thermodesulfobacteriota bacterium]
MTKENKACEHEPCQERRSFLKGGGAVLAGATLLGQSKKTEAGTLRTSPRSIQQAAPLQTDQDVQVVHSVCLGCNARCGNRSVVKNGRLEKYSGNPYHPYNHLGNPIDYTTPVKETLSLSSPVCGKAHDAPNYVYNPYRIIKPLKRSGKRGSGKFEPIEWEQMIEEISGGGKLFAHLGEERHVGGLKQLNSDEPIDADALELGPKRNGFIFVSGRMQSGRKEFIDRFVKSSMGSINRIGHTDICGLGFRMGNLALTEKKQVELKADPWGSEYILVFGANIYEALQPGVNTYGAAVANRSSQGKVKFVIVDPRAQNASTHAEDWLPVKPGQDGALAMGMIRRMIEQQTYNKKYLTAPNPKAAAAIGHGCYANASHLVIDDENHANYRKFLRISDLNQSSTDKKDNRYVVLAADGSPVAFDAISTALLDKEIMVSDANGKKIKAKTAFRMMKEGVMQYSLAEYSEFSGIPQAQIEKTADEFCSHGTKAAVCQYHGAGNYTNGTYAAYGVAMLSCLVGSVEIKGGYMTSGGGAAKHKQGLYDLKSFPGKLKGKGVRISREKASYEKSSEFRRKKESGGNGYPAKRPWFSFTKGGLSVETMSSIDAQYPYPCKILFTYFYNPVYSTPGGYRYQETLLDTDKVPLHVSIDTCVNESNLYADYIIPDVTYAEGHYGWLTPHAPALKFTGIRTPCIEPLTDKTKDDRPYCLETFLIDLAENIGLGGFGPNGIIDNKGKSHPLHRAEDFYLRGFANIAHGAKAPMASVDEINFIEKNYPLARFKEILSPQEWRQTCYVLARGGVFKKYEDVFDGEKFKHGLKRIVLYNEDLAISRNSLTGEFFPGTLTYLPPADSAGNILAERDKEYPFTIITHKMNVHTQSRTTSHRYAMEIFPENFVVMNEVDAGSLSIKDDDLIRLLSRSNTEGITGKVKTSKLIRRGCLGISFHYGHSQLGASKLPISKGETVFMGGKKVVDKDGLIPDPKLGSGINPNMVSRLDENLANTPLVDLTGGIPDFSSTRVQIIKEV